MSLRIQNPLVGELLTAAFRLTGRIQPQLEEFIVPVVVVGDLGDGGPIPVRRAAISSSFFTAVPGELPTATFECPPGTMCQITKFFVLGPPGSTLTMRVSFTNAGVIQPAAAKKDFTDGRLTEENQRPVGTLFVGSQAGNIGPITGHFVFLDTSRTEIHPKNWIIGSGKLAQFGHVQFQISTANIDITWGVEWIEYPLT